MSLLLFLSAAVVVVQGGSVANFNCPRPDGLFADPTDCSYFYQCSGGVAYHQQCPPGLIFNAAQGYCDWPANTVCNAGQATTTTTRQTTAAASTTSTSKATTAAAPTSTARPATTTAAPTTKAPTTSSKPPTTASASTTTTKAPTTTTGSGVSGDCNVVTQEPISAEVRALRQATCMLPNAEVEKVAIGSATNPANVRILESIFPPENFKVEFPNANSAYTYLNLLKAFAKFPRVCTTTQDCRRTLATIFAHFQQETAGLYYLKEINQDYYCADWSDWVTAAYPCYSGQRYFGRGAKQLSWNYNYGALSSAMFGDSQVLLKNPDLVSDTWLNFASALWFFVTPQPPKPSMQQVVEKTWVPNQHDLAGKRVQGFGTTTMIINGALECGPSPSNPTASYNRQNYYRKFAADFGVDISGEKLDCLDMGAFDDGGSANPAIYWAPEGGCSLATWQTAYSALVEGEYTRCKQNAKP